MNAIGGCGGDVVFVTNAVNELQENAGKFESGGVWFAVGLALGLGLGKPPGTPLVRWRLKFDTTNTPITIAAISAAARPAIQNGPGRAGARSLSADRTRADSAGLVLSGLRHPDLPMPRRGLASPVADEGEDPRAQRPGVAPQLSQLARGFERPLPNGILGGGSTAEHHRRQPVGRIEERLDQKS